MRHVRVDIDSDSRFWIWDLRNFDAEIEYLYQQLSQEVAGESSKLRMGSSYVMWKVSK
jgi:hypothetical protein